ncbi:hypothetical protein GGX14DRAFT_387986 [Mycena pura]|uniref:Uncharacterized protein n=1 Tax=Mycena pura TaxID=153505 RepID=A0AAD6VU07_9AGAR|nr:hypothetical protein GGX14DRAFT_387986 [Mycena pura]
MYGGSTMPTPLYLVAAMPKAWTHVRLNPDTSNAVFSYIFCIGVINIVPLLPNTSATLNDSQGCDTLSHADNRARRLYKASVACANRRASDTRSRITQIGGNRGHLTAVNTTRTERSGYITRQRCCRVRIAHAHNDPDNAALLPQIVDGGSEHERAGTGGRQCESCPRLAGAHDAQGGAQRLLDAKKSNINNHAQEFSRDFCIIFEPNIAEVVGADEQSGAGNVRLRDA